MSAKLTYKNKQTGKKYTGTAEEVKAIKNNPLLANLYSYEAEELAPKEVKTTNTAESK